MHMADYATKYADHDGKLKQIQEQVADLQKELKALRKTQADKELVLETSPLYLLIPGFGFFIMAGVLLGVGIDFGLKKEELQGKINKLELAQTKLSSEHNFFNNYTGSGLDNEDPQRSQDGNRFRWEAGKSVERAHARHAGTGSQAGGGERPRTVGRLALRLSRPDHSAVYMGCPGSAGGSVSSLRRCQESCERR